MTPKQHVVHTEHTENIKPKLSIKIPIDKGLIDTSLPKIQKYPDDSIFAPHGFFKNSGIKFIVDEFNTVIGKEKNKKIVKLTQDEQGFVVMHGFKKLIKNKK